MFGACILLVHLTVNVGIVEFFRASCAVMPGGEGTPVVETPNSCFAECTVSVDTGNQRKSSKQLETLLSYVDELRSGLSPD